MTLYLRKIKRKYVNLDKNKYKMRLIKCLVAIFKLA